MCIFFRGGDDWYLHGKLESLAFYVVVLVVFVMFIIYLLTKPKKEIIFNRLEGTITFPGWWWKKNITMRFSDMKFGYTAPGTDGNQGYQLQILRPDRMGTYEFFAMGTWSCYKDLSFITWYMDKNRPLPPGEAFDEFREKDFKRRKAEGFPSPLYPSEIRTPEMNQKQTMMSWGIDPNIAKNGPKYNKGRNTMKKKSRH